jgi:uncharacterized membrane protein YkoI
MTRFSSRLVAVAIAVLFTAAAVARADDEEKVPLDKLPKAVSAAVKKQFPKAELVGASKETEDGKTVYEVSLKDGDVKADVSLTADGTLLGIEKVIAAKDLPKAAADAVAAKYPKATVKLAEEVTKFKDGKAEPAYYEMHLVTTDKKAVEVEVAADGKILKTEEKKEDQKD